MSESSKDSRFSLRLPPGLAERLIAAAKAEERTISEFMREVLRRELAKRED